VAKRILNASVCWRPKTRPTRRHDLVALILALLCVHCVGCSGYKIAHLPSANSDVCSESSNSVVAKIGHTATVLLTTGIELEGRIVAIDSVSITLQNVGNYGSEERTIASSDIEQVKVIDGGSAAGKATKAGSIAVSSLLILFLVVGVLW